MTFQVYAGEPRKPLGVFSTRQPLQPRVHYSVAGAGGSVVLAIPPGITTSQPFRFWQSASRASDLSIVEIGTTGDTLRTLSFRPETKPVTRADVAAIVDSLVNPPQLANGIRPRGVPGAIRDSLRVPRAWPAVTQLYSGADASLWLRQPAPPSREARYWRIGPNGAPLPSVPVPSSLRIVVVTANRFWAVRTSESGVESVEVRDVR